VKYLIFSVIFLWREDIDDEPSFPKEIQNLHRTELTSLLFVHLEAISRPYSSTCASLKGVIRFFDIENDWLRKNYFRRS
jgi:hypothetical protein